VPLVAEVAQGIRKKLIINGIDYDTHDGTCVRDYIHVQDLALAHVKALDYLIRNNGKYVFNVGTGNGLSVLDVIKSFEKANKIKINYKYGPRRKGDVEKIYSDCKNIKNVLGWEAVNSMEAAMKTSWNWQKNKII